MSSMYPNGLLTSRSGPPHGRLAKAILEDLFTSRGDECWRYDVRVADWLWADLAARLIGHDIGVLVAFRSAGDQEIRINPRPDAPVDADKLYVLVRAGNARPDGEIADLLWGDAG